MIGFKVILWEPLYGQRSRGRPIKTYIDRLVDDAGCTEEHLPNAMEHRELWKKCVIASRAGSN